MTIRADDLVFLGCYRHSGVSGAAGLTPSWSGPFKGYAFTLEGLTDEVKVFRVPTAEPHRDPAQAPATELVLNLGPIWRKANHRRGDSLPPFNLVPSMQDPEVRDGQYRAQGLWYDDRQQLLAFMITPWYAHGWLPGGGGYPTLAYIDIRPMVTRQADGTLTRNEGALPIVYGPWRWDVTDQVANQIIGYAPPDCQAALNEHPEIAGPGPHLLAVGQERSGLILGTWGPGLTILQRPNKRSPACDLRVMSCAEPGADVVNPGEVAWPKLRGALAVHHPCITMFINEPGVKRPEQRNCSPLPNPWRVRDGVIRYDPTGPLSESSWELIWGGRHQSWTSCCQRPYYRYTCDGFVIGPSEPAESGRPVDEVFPHPAWLDGNKNPVGSNPYNQDAHKHTHAQLVVGSNGRRSLLVQGAAFVGARWYGHPAEFVSTEFDVPETAEPVTWTFGLAAGDSTTSDDVSSLAPPVVDADTHLLRFDIGGDGVASLVVEASEDDGETWAEFWSPGPKGDRRPYVYDSALVSARYNHLAPPSDGYTRYRLRVTAMAPCTLTITARQFAPGGPAVERFRSRYFPGQWVYDRSFGGRGYGEEARFLTFGFLPLTPETALGQTPRATFLEEVRAVDQWPGFVTDETSLPWAERPVPLPGAQRVDLSVDVRGGYQRGKRVYLLTTDAWRPDPAKHNVLGAVINVFEVK